MAIDNTFEDMFHYSIASYYVNISDVPNSISHCEKAISLFTKSQNYERLNNTNIIVGNQYLRLKNYKKAFNLNQSVLDTAYENNDLFNQRVALNNIAFIYMMQNKYNEAVQCFDKMSKEYMREKHYYSYMICLAEVDDFDKGKAVCLEGKSICTIPYYKYMFKIYEKYFEDKNIKRLSKNIEKSFEKFDDFISDFEKEFLCVLLSHQFKKDGNLKKAIEYFEKLQELNYF